MKKYKLTKKDIYEGNLILVNQDNLRKNIVDEKSLAVFNSQYTNILLNKDANRNLQKLLHEIKGTKKIVPVSGFRKTLEQIKIYNDSLTLNGLEFTKKYVAIPHASEHETGLSIDLGLKSPQIDFICPKFPHNGICEEFRKLAWRYGFIERYKSNKENITNIAAEEWHFRYVGYPHSVIMTQMDFCLEEYITYLKNNKITYQNYVIHYLPFKKDMEIILGDKDEISGNNIDGFIITKKIKDDNNE